MLEAVGFQALLLFLKYQLLLQPLFFLFDLEFFKFELGGIVWGGAAGKTFLGHPEAFLGCHVLGRRGDAPQHTDDAPYVYPVRQLGNRDTRNAKRR